ncbi:hypothetical protein [Aureliella helgolandensis]|uniref:TIGR04255 family protein n=1 Tax=Aureliella helgolandensis TaxID=2527968 RepID=A0A518G782_9BACT|nr:hypothetical protein [Aureliella helgolandensis]QDV24445.1 hypothetical protein Q31a_27630 [Aureliella helgolandensis]
MHKYGALCDEFYLNMHLGTEMELPQNREAILHFFEQVQKRFPRMSNFYARDNGEFCLEEEKEAGRYRWISTEPKRVCSGAVNPESLASAIDQHQMVLELIPYELSISHLDCESLNITMGFDFNYRGNHNELLAEALGMISPMERFSELKGTSILSYEPILQIALDDECKTQCRLAFESRTTAYQVRSDEYAEEPLSVYLTVRRYDSLASHEKFGEELLRLAGICEQMADDYLVEGILKPLRQTIALK